MKRAVVRIPQGVYGLTLLIAMMICLAGCGRRSELRIPEPPAIEFSRYISAFSGGVMSTDETIQVQFAFAIVDSATVGREVDPGLFRIRPSVDGKAFWKNSRTVEFRPSQQLPHDQVFNVTFHLDKLINVERELKEFRFGFVTMPQAAQMHIEHVGVYTENNQPRLRIRGVIETADAAPSEKVREMLKLSRGFGNDNEIRWVHGSRNRRHTFTISNISRSHGEHELVIDWSARPIGARDQGAETISIPEPGTFRLVHTHFEQLPEPRISLQFSEKVDQQNLSGLIYFQDMANLSTRISDNEILIFTRRDLTGRHVLSVEASVRDVNGSRLGEKVVHEFNFEDLKPGVRLAGRGVIIPSSRDLLFPFEAVNLAAVDVEVVRIFEDNILQFLQINQIDGNDQLRRVGRIAARRTMPLNTGNVTNLNQWNRFAIDLADVIDPEPGAIYRVYLSFRKEYALYPCGDDHQTLTTILASLDTSWEQESDQISYWGSYGPGYNYRDYVWSERDNPCHQSYYVNTAVSRNILASNLGVIAKKQTDGTWEFAVTDLVTTRPVNGAAISLYNFQQQLLEKVETDRQGFARVRSRGVPYVAAVAKEEQRAYLRLDDGSALSMSMFDVDGARVQEGLKGFIYGDRGVWRPGDTLFLSFILEDRYRTLPENYPVVFNFFNPNGQLVKSEVSRNGINGFYHFSPVTDPDAPTGNYTASFKLGGVEFARSLRVETIMPNRLRINTSFEGDELIGFGVSNGSVHAEWLHGGAARSLRAEVTATLNATRTAFQGFGNYSFDDPTRQFVSETFPIFQGRLDATGRTTLVTDIGVSSRAPGKLMAAVETKVFEEGGAFSIDRRLFPFHSFPTYAGVAAPTSNRAGSMLETGTSYTIDLVNVDKNGMPVDREGLRVDIFRIGWRWWWDGTDEYFGDFSAGSHNRPVYTQTLQTSNGKASLSWGIDFPDWGRYLVLVTDIQSGHRAGDIVYFDWPSWYGGTREGMQQAASMLTFSLDKEVYEPGENMVFTFPSSGGGRALVSLESGSRIIDRKWVETSDESTTFRIRATPEMAPNVYAHITLLQPHAQTVNDLPIRLYGVLPVRVEDPATKLEPQIIMPDVLKPEDEVTISVKEASGKAMTYTLALVDEGLLDLTRFQTPDPWAHFYAREALGIKTWDMYDHVMGAFGSEFSRLLGIGGDDYIQPPVAGERATRFRPVVRFFGPFALERGRTQSHTFRMPQYAGSVRVMVVAGQEGAYGKADKTIPVRQSLMALGTLPRVMGPGEQVKFPVNVFALDETVREAQITIQTNEMFQVQGPSSQRITFSEPGDKLVYFDLTTPDREGVAKVVAEVKSGSETTTFEIELDVRNANVRQTFVENLMLEGNASGEVQFRFRGMPQSREAVLELSSIPPINLEKRLSFLMQFPHGCSEQIISGTFPQLYLDSFYEMSVEEKEKVQQNVSSVIDRLARRQLPSGGISMWPGGNRANEWVSTYAGHFLIEAEKKGFALPQGFMSSWARFQRDMANRWVSGVEGMGGDLIQAYRLYTLALSGNTELGAMNRMRQRDDLSVQARWQLAGAYLAAGHQEAATQLIDNLPQQVEPYRQMAYTYGDQWRDKAIIITVLTKLNRKDQATHLVRELAEVFASSQWLSTQTTAFGLKALADFYRGTSFDEKMQVSFTENEGREEEISTSSLIWIRDLAVPTQEDNKQIAFRNKGSNPVFVRVIHSGIPLAGQEIAGNENLGMAVRFTNLSGAAINVSNLKQGTSFIAEVTVSNPGHRGDYREMALSRIFPSGWEVGNIRMDAGAAAIQQDSPTYEDIRDDRVYTYFDLPANTAKTFKVMLTATYEGRYYLPAFNVEAMYDASVYARNRGMWVEVVRE